jgi:hypothetical protein
MTKALRYDVFRARSWQQAHLERYLGLISSLCKMCKMRASAVQQVSHLLPLLIREAVHMPAEYMILSTASAVLPDCKTTTSSSIRADVPGELLMDYVIAVFDRKR